MRALFLIAAVSFATQLPARDVPRAEVGSHQAGERCPEDEAVAGVPAPGEAISPLLAPQRSMI